MHEQTPKHTTPPHSLLHQPRPGNREIRMRPAQASGLQRNLSQEDAYAE